MKKASSCVEKNKIKRPQTSVEKIDAAFHKLSPQYEINAIKLELILSIGDVLSGTWPERLKRKQNTSRPARNLNAAEKEIDKVEVAAKKLRCALNAMDVSTCFISEKAEVHIVKFEEALTITIKEAEEARKAIEQLKRNCPQLASRKSGRPENKGALYIAEILSEEFFRATGKPPTFSVCDTPEGYRSSGKFLDLVRSIFSALEIKASPESMARQAHKIWCSRRSFTDTKHKSISRSKEKTLSKRE